MKTLSEPQPSPSRPDTVVHYSPLLLPGLSHKKQSWMSSCPCANQRRHSQNSVCLVQLSRPFPDWYLRGDNGDSSVLLLSWKEGNWASEDVDSTDMGHERICQRSGGWRGYGCCGGTLLESLTLVTLGGTWSCVRGIVAFKLNHTESNRLKYF